jgi:4-aminobutyrate aminotransferase-like enzyme
VLGRAEIMNWPADSFTSTFLTNNLNLAAATAAIGVLKDERLAERAGRLGEIAGKRLKQSLGNLRSIAELRGIGLWFGIELMDRFGRPAAEGAREAARRLRDRGVVVGRGGVRRQCRKAVAAANDRSQPAHGGAGSGERGHSRDCRVTL